MSKDTEKILASYNLDNGLQVTIFDKSRLVAGDRWYLKIICVTEGAYAAEQCQEMLDGEQYQAFVEKYPECRVRFQYEKERNFVDDAIKDEVLQSLIDNIVESNLDYMAKVSFAENLLQKIIEEFIQEFNVKKELALLEEETSVTEPDDFSACFK
jgi:hypothetical protein